MGFVEMLHLHLEPHAGHARSVQEVAAVLAVLFVGVFLAIWIYWSLLTPYLFRTARNP